MKLLNCLMLIFLALGIQLMANDSNPTELGKVNWQRDLDQGVVQSTKEQKPIFLLFQEVPGCSTCRNYGQNVLSHPLIVEAIETLFVPVAIFNNKGGKDAATLKYFGEPSWNNPVVRIIDADKKNLVNRVNGNYSRLGIVQAMVQALQAESLTVPSYLSLLEEELLAEYSGTESTTLSMYCFWSGEREIGKLDGVVETQAGFMNGREVVQVKYDPTILTFNDLLSSAKDASCADQVFTDDAGHAQTAQKVLGKNNLDSPNKFRQDREPKYYLGKTVYRFIPMTQLQAVKVNSLIGQGKVPNELLSPRQITLLKQIQSQPNGQWQNAINQDFVKAWEKVEAQQKA